MEVELGQIDINVEVALLYRCLAQTWKGQRYQALHILSYLKRYSFYMIVFDSNGVAWYDIQFNWDDWVGFYDNTKDDIPPNSP